MCNSILSLTFPFRRANYTIIKQPYKVLMQESIYFIHKVPFELIVSFISFIAIVQIMYSLMTNQKTPTLQIRRLVSPHTTPISVLNIPLPFTELSC